MQSIFVATLSLRLKISFFYVVTIVRHKIVFDATPNDVVGLEGGGKIGKRSEHPDHPD